MVGSPGSGKSLFAQDMIKRAASTSGSTPYVWVNQDTLKTKPKCEAVMRAALNKGESVIVDNTNPLKSDRNLWIGIAKSCSVTSIRCVYVDCPKVVSMTFAKIRSHVTHGQRKGIPDVVIHTFYKKLEVPEKGEGFSEVVTVPWTLDVEATENKGQKEWSAISQNIAGLGLVSKSRTFRDYVNFQL